MADREPRKRKKRKESQKKEDLNVFESVPAREKTPEKKESDSESEDNSHAYHEPSAAARITFFIIFGLLIVGVGAVFIALHGADKALDSHKEDVNNPGSVAPVEELKNEIHIEEAKLHKLTEEPVSESFVSDREISGTEPLSILPSVEEITIEQHTFVEESSVPKSEDRQEPPYTADPAQTQNIALSDVPEKGNLQGDENFESVISVSVAQETLHLEPPSPNLIHTEDVVPLPSESLIQTKQEEASETFQPYSLEATKSSKTPEVDSSVISSSSTTQSPAPPNEKADITNSYDETIQKDLDDSEEYLDKLPEKALSQFEIILKKHPHSPRAMFGKAAALARIAEIKKSNDVLDQAIDAYFGVLNQPDITDKLYLKAGTQLAEKLRFRGLFRKAIQHQILLSQKFPDNVDVKNQLAVSYLLIGRGKDAKTVLKTVLQTNPNNGFAKVHLGFILKTEDNDLTNAIKYLREGIQSKEPGVIDGRFYFHLGDALARTGRNSEAMKVYEDGVKEGLFYSVYQRSLYNVKGLRAHPWWNISETPYEKDIKKLEQNWNTIRSEALALLDDKMMGFQPESENLKDTGDWKQFEMFARGRKIGKNCSRAPKTCALLESIPNAAGCKRGQVKFSIMQPGTHVWAHTGPTNCRLRAHLGLVVPKNVKIRVANDTREWQEGKTIMFDDSFEHEVWHNGNSLRLVLIMDFWHPDLTAKQKLSLSPI